MYVWKIHKNREKVKRKEMETDGLVVFRLMASMFAQQMKSKRKPRAQIPLKTKQAITKLSV